MFKYSVTATVNDQGYSMKVSYGREIRDTFADESGVWAEMDDVVHVIKNKFREKNIFSITETIIQYNDSGRIKGKHSITTYPMNDFVEEKNND